jgi:tRNA (adenine57-N1/adenine58-N1)-methyltransferase catalytic subunit
MDIKKLLLDGEGRIFYVKDDSKDYHCQFGFVKAEDLKKKDGSEVLTSIGKKLVVLSPSFIDKYAKIKRMPQIIPLKDVGAIVALTGIGNKSKVVDAGTGSGATTCFIANIAKHVTSYEIRPDFIKVAEENVINLGLKNVTLKNQDVCKGIDEKNVDVVLFDLPNPWEAVDAAAKALKSGGFIVSYSPTIPQVIDYAEKLRQSGFASIRIIEVIERDWESEGRKTRPLSQQIGHSGFLTFARKINK